MPNTIVVVEPGFYFLASLLGLAIAGWAVTMVIQFNAVKGSLMGINEDLAQIKANLAEASGELVGKIESLEKQNVAESVDPQLLSDVKNLAESLSDIVPDAVPSAVEQGTPSPVDNPVPPVVEQAVPEKLGEGKLSKKDEDTADGSRTPLPGKGEGVDFGDVSAPEGNKPDDLKGNKPDIDPTKSSK